MYGHKTVIYIDSEANTHFPFTDYVMENIGNTKQIVHYYATYVFLTSS